jgi:hypothetical protein
MLRVEGDTPYRLRRSKLLIYQITGGKRKGEVPGSGKTYYKCARFTREMDSSPFGASCIPARFLR